MVSRKKAPIKKSISKSATVKTQPSVDVTAIFSPDRRITVNVGTCGEYGRSKVGLALSENVKEGDDPMALVDSIFDTLADKLIEKYNDLSEVLDGDFEEEDEPPKPAVNPKKSKKDEDDEEEWDDEEDDEEEDDEEEWDDEEDDEEEDEEDEDEEDDLTEDEIKKMKKAELVTLIDDEELDVDIKGMKLAEIRTAVIDALFEEDEDDEDDGDDEEWDDEEWDDEEDDK